MTNTTNEPLQFTAAPVTPDAAMLSTAADLLVAQLPGMTRKAAGALADQVWQTMMAARPVCDHQPDAWVFESCVPGCPDDWQLDFSLAPIVPSPLVRRVTPLFGLPVDNSVRKGDLRQVAGIWFECESAETGRFKASALPLATLPDFAQTVIKQWLDTYKDLGINQAKQLEPKWVATFELLGLLNVDENTGRPIDTTLQGFHLANDYQHTAGVPGAALEEVAHA